MCLYRLPGMAAALARPPAGPPTGRRPGVADRTTTEEHLVGVVDRNQAPSTTFREENQR